MMTGIVELWARQLGWRVSRGNVIVEGESDVFYLEHAARLYRKKYGIDPLGDELSIIAAGRGNDGGVDGVNERFRAARELASVDVHADGATKFRFIGLFDNDEEGRRAFRRGTGLSRRIEGYRDLFLLHPVMPFANGTAAHIMRQRSIDLNQQYSTLDWEIEDLLSSDIYEVFEADNRREIIHSTTVGGKTHRDLTWSGKVKLRQCVQHYAELRDVVGLIALIRSLRSYVRLPHDHLVLPEE